MIPNDKTISVGDYVSVRNASNDKDAPAMIGIVVAVYIDGSVQVQWETGIREVIDAKCLEKINP